MSKSQTQLTELNTTKEQTNNINTEINRMVAFQQLDQNTKDKISQKLTENIEESEAVEKVLKTTSMEEILKGISKYGNCKELLKTKPSNDNGLHEYIWRMATFHAGSAGSIPIMADVWLKDYIENNTDLNISKRSDEFTEITKALELIEMACLIQLGHDPTKKSRHLKNTLF